MQDSDYEIPLAKSKKGDTPKPVPPQQTIHIDQVLHLSVFAVYDLSKAAMHLDKEPNVPVLQALKSVAKVVPPTQARREPTAHVQGNKVHCDIS